MVPREAGRILPLALVLAAVAVVSWARGPPDALRPGQGCSELGRCCPGRDPTCIARGPPRCFCDQGCGAARDCCADYSRACPAVSCIVAEWSGWSRCAKPCQVSYRVRRRHVLQEPRNGGVPCPHLEEQAGCVEYRSHQGVECQQSLFPALITTGRYGKERKKQSVLKGQEILGYCVQFQLGPIPGSCWQEPAVAVASGRPPPVPRDVGEAWAAPGLFLPRGPQPHLHLVPRPPNRPDPSFLRPPREPPVPELGFHRVQGVGRSLQI